MKVEDIKKGDIITYRNGKINRVNKPFKYHMYYSSDFKNYGLYSGFDIMKIQRLKKVLCFYILKTIYRRKDENN